ncbi:MAG: hypothetical protein ABL892_09700, partial [Thiobacillaceae bacterium]
SLGRDQERPVDQRIGQTLRSPPAKPGVYFTELLRRLDDKKMSALEVVAIQLEIEDEELNE